MKPVDSAPASFREFEYSLANGTIELPMPALLASARKS
jgi:hypothetical protein